MFVSLVSAYNPRMATPSTTARTVRPFVPTNYFCDAGNAACEKAWIVANECEAEYCEEDNFSSHRAYFTGALMSQLNAAYEKIGRLENRVENLLKGED